MKTITVTQVFHTETVLSATPTAITPAFIAACFPGAAFWSRFRVEKLAFWGQNLVANGSGLPAVSGQLRVDIPSDPSWNQPPMRFVDDGIQGQSRPKVAFKLGLLDRARFFTPADETIICTVSGSPAEVVTCQFSIQLVSPPAA